MVKKKIQKSVEELVADALLPKEDQPYEIPENWLWSPIGQLTNIISGGTPRTSNDKFYTGGNIAWITPADLSKYNKKLISKGKKNITELGLVKSSARIIPKNSVLFSSRAPIGYVAIAENELTTNQGFKSFEATKFIDSEFLYWYLKYSIDLIEAMASGTTFKEISGKKAAQIPFPLPPLAEQKRIVTKLSSMLEKLKQAKELIREAKESFEKRRATILHLAFTGQLTESWRTKNINTVNDFKKDHTVLNSSINIPKSWVCLPFGKIASIKTNLVDPSDYSNYPHIAPNNIEKKTGELLEFKSIGEDRVKSPKHLFQKGDIIYSKIRPYLSKVIIADFEGLCSADMYPIETVLNRSFLYNYMLSQIFLDYATTAGTRTVLPKINQKELNRIPVVCPSLDEQKEIVKILDNLLGNEAEASSLLELENQIDLIEKSILSKAFRGELDTNDSDDEPGKDLLKRILQDRQKTPKKKTVKNVSKAKGNKFEATMPTFTASIRAVSTSSKESQYLFETIKEKMGKRSFSIDELKSIVDLSYEDLKFALFDLIKEPLEINENSTLKMVWENNKYSFQLASFVGVK